MKITRLNSSKTLVITVGSSNYGCTVNVSPQGGAEGLRIRTAGRAHTPELSPVVAHAFRGAILGRSLQHHDVDRPGGVASAGPDQALPIPSESRLNVGDGQSTDGKPEECKSHCEMSVHSEDEH